MFWKCIRWGGSTIVALLLLAAALLCDYPKQVTTPASETQASKNFNL